MYLASGKGGREGGRRERGRERERVREGGRERMRKSRSVYHLSVRVVREECILRRICFMKNRCISRARRSLASLSLSIYLYIRISISEMKDISVGAH